MKSIKGRPENTKRQARKQSKAGNKTIKGKQ
jgi:hypothetical protein